MRGGTKARKAPISEGDETRALGLVFLIAIIPVLAAVLLIRATTEPDLSDLTPAYQSSDAVRTIGWPALWRDEPNARIGIPTGASVRILGYMMDGEQPIPESQTVHNFVLLPDAGTLLHPAHRFGDQMITVRLQESESFPFKPRGLVWVWGTLRVSSGKAVEGTPLYAIEQARVQGADKREIERYYK